MNNDVALSSPSGINKQNHTGPRTMAGVSSPVPLDIPQCRCFRLFGLIWHH
jgi:hypothetical protein